MRETLPLKSIVYTIFVILVSCSIAAAQTEGEKVKRNKNFIFSQNPKTKSEKTEDANKTEAPPVEENKNVEIKPETETPTVETEDKNTEDKNFESRSVASKTLEVVKKANMNAVSPTEIYKIGIGDVLFISLQNAPAKTATYYTVLNDGTIDYPLAGEMLPVSGLTTEELEDLLKEKVKLFENPQISVKVRENTSHSVTVLGLVEKAGEKFLPREAVPLFLIRAEAIVQPKANLLVIKRRNSDTEQVDLRDGKSDDVLIFPGDILEFKSTDDSETGATTSQFYYIGGNIAAGGQKDFHSGLSLTQAILASGGLKKSNARKVIVRRKNQEGLLVPTEYDLNAIKNGKEPDPQIKAGDTIEIGN